MKKYIIPTLALAVGMTAVGVHGASAQILPAVSTTNAVTSAVTTPVTGSTSTSTNANVNSNNGTTTSVSSSSTVNTDTKIAAIIKKSDAAINARISSLNKMSARLAKMKHLTDAQRASLTATVQTSIQSMTTLKAKIDADTDLATAKADYTSITKNYRIFAVVLPSENTIAVTDNAMANVTAYQTTLATLQTRITAAKTAGKDTTTVQASLDDATAKLADAATQSQALITAASSLKVDMGDKTIQASNKTQITAAATARKALLADVASARKDIAAIRTGLKALKV